MLHGTEATQNRDFLHFGATFWLYFSRKQPHPKAFFSWKLLAPLSTARKQKKIFG